MSENKRSALCVVACAQIPDSALEHGVINRVLGKEPKGLIRVLAENGGTISPQMLLHLRTIVADLDALD